MHLPRWYRAAALGSLLTAGLVAQTPVGRAPGRSFAPTFQPRLAAPIGAHPVARVSRTFAGADTLRILGLLVEFQPDADSRTVGTGVFDTSTANAAIIDPPPHDAAFFDTKMRFVENYFRKVSDGKLIVEGDVLPNPVTVGETMDAYTRDVTPRYHGLARLAAESWMRADTAYPAVDLARYDAFVLFHAGTGKDIDLISIYGYDPAPYDVPSVYLSLDAFRTAFDSSGFNGISLRGGTVTVKNTMILPETEMRALAGSSGQADTLELSINGLFAASIGSYLGLPDLFNTVDGHPGIGQFGLMDGASIFAYGGLFPPEPSAWEKVALGWVTPIVVNRPLDSLVLPAVSSTSVEDTIYKVPITATEYFLVENRNRDPLGNGQRLSIVRNGVTTIFTAPKDSVFYFTFDNVSGIDGSVVDVEDFDWAILGYFSSTHLYDGGGVLIWHVDEDVINAGLATNTVNVDIDHRGVSLEEADGAQDIGRSYGTISGGAGTESGSPLDAWFSSNNATSYTNRFDDSSFPNSRSYSGASSLITIRAFSDRSPRMTAIVEFGGKGWQSLPGFPKRIAGVVGTPVPFDGDGNGSDELFAVRTLRNGKDARIGDPVGRGALLAWNEDGTPLYGNDSAAVVAEVNGPLVGAPVLFTFGAAPGFVAAAEPSSLHVWRIADVNADQRLDSVRVISLPADTAAWDIVFEDSVFVAYGPGGIAFRGFSGTDLGSFPTGATAVASTGVPGHFAAASGPQVIEYVFGGAGPAVQGLSVSTAGTVGGLAAGEVVPGERVVVALSTGVAGYSRMTTIASAGFTVTGSFDLGRFLSSGETVVSAPILTDVNNDGRNEVVVALSSGRIVAISTGGVLVDGSPERRTLAGGWNRVDLVSAELSSPAGYDAVTVDPSGVFRSPGADPSGGLQAANRATAACALGVVNVQGNSRIGLFVTDSLGGIHVWDTGTPNGAGRLAWPMPAANARRSNFSVVASLAPRPLGNSFLPKERVYNWPNPVYGEVTYIRLWTDREAEVTVTIRDVAGDLVATLRGRASAGQDTELPWNVRGIGSGVYFARVSASGAGASGETIIKVAIVR